MTYLLIGGVVLAGLMIGVVIWNAMRPEPHPWAEENFYGGHWPVHITSLRVD